MAKAKEKISMEPHPDNILVRISKAAWDELFFKRIIRDDGKEVDLFTRVEEKEGYDGRFAQNVSVGHIVAVGVNVKNVFLSDIAILDYLVSNNNDMTIGFFNGDKIVSMKAVTTYHDKPSRLNQNNRRAYNKGDIDVLSPLLGVVRKKEIIAFAPNVFIEHKSSTILLVSNTGVVMEQKEDVCTRKVISAAPDSDYQDGDVILVKDEDMMFRSVENKEIALAMDWEILAKKRYVEA